MIFKLSETVAILRRTPRVLPELVRGLPEAWTQNAEGPETWSARDVVAHLTELEEQDWMPRLRIILEHGEARPFTPVDRVAFRVRFPRESADELLTLFAQRRAENLRVLDGLCLTADQLALAGTHPALGRVTLANLLAAWAVHDLNHTGQIVRVMAKSYREAVGPWAPYLPIISRPWGDAR
jgi:uncharacterized damage-inducible protein DinB